MRIRDIFKRTLAAGLVAIAILQTCVTAFAYNNSYIDQLGTNQALGSPILNNNFVLDDWNKWEMIGWGVFLSNFATPLIDDYESAFNSNSSQGSKGSGYKALQFGSGSDPANAGVMQGLLNYAITQQKTGAIKQVYVKHTKAEGLDTVVEESTSNEVIQEPIENEESTEGESLNENGVIVDLGEYRPATFADFIFMGSEKEGDTFIDVSDVDGSVNKDKKFVLAYGYKPIYTFKEASIPTFTVRAGTAHEIVFDYTNSWDLQILNAWFGRLLHSDLSSKFADELNNIWKEASSLPVYMDCFGNLVIQYKGSNRMFIPAAANQHITDTPKINLINSLIFNGYMGSANSTNLQLLGQQVTWSKWGWIKSLVGLGSGTGDSGGKPDKSGVPALGSRISGIKPGTVLLYYDLDNVIMKDRALSGDTIRVVRDGEYGEKVKKLFDLDINNLTGNYSLKLEVSNMADSNIGKLNEGIQTALEKTALASSMISNITQNNAKAQVLSTVKSNNEDIKLFDNPAIISVQADVGREKSKINADGAARLFPTFLYEVYAGKKDATTTGIFSRQDVENILSKSSTVDSLRENSLVSESGNISPLAAGFIAENTNLFKMNLSSPKDLLKTKAPSASSFFSKLGTVKFDGNLAVTPKYDTSGSEDSVFQRMIKAYPVSNNMVIISNILGARDGQEFAQWSAFIYMTYLDWYGVSLKKEIGQKPIVTSEFNKRIFDDKSDVLEIDITSIANIKTEEDKKKDVLNYSYLMLHPTEGREYRKDMMMSGMTDWVYENYNNIVYGNASSYYSSVNSNLATRNATGFLNIDSYSDNMLTSWFMSMYSTLVVWILAGAFVLAIAIGVVRRKKLSWYLITMVVIINAILFIPAAGEIVPYVTNKYVQQMFNGKMTYWGISEGVTNANLEKDLVEKTSLSGVSGLSKSDAAQVAEMVKALNVTYLDRSLMLKTDISRKVTETASGNYSAIQSFRSARWILPMIMRQFTANDGSADYVYIPVGDLFDDMSNMYWFYNQSDALGTSTVNGQQEVVKNNNFDTETFVSNIKGNFSDYEYLDTYINDKWSSLSYYNYDSNYQSLTAKNNKDVIHTFFYIPNSDINKMSLLPRGSGFKGTYKIKDASKNYVESAVLNGSSSSASSLASSLESLAGSYIRSDRNTVDQSFGYLWATENPAHYFYQNVKDTFADGSNLGSIVGDLQGTVVINENNQEVRKSFMHSYDTGNIRDIADLEGLFRNTIPYLYQMMLTTGGTDGTSGLLMDSKISNYDIYKNNYKSWMFRSNWVVKLLENDKYNQKTTVKDSNGNEYVVENPTMPECYPLNRPMIFSEAQRVEMGISESSLTLVELKCIEVNKNIERRWTLLLNYANTNGMTKEVMMRQMALESLLEFNKEFSPTTLLSGSKAMYPNSLDLRAISFDSVMKMLILNVTKDTTYIYGDAMSNVVEDSDIFTSILLLMSAFLCCYIIPLFRNVVLAAIFYLGLFAIIRAIVAGNSTKSKISLGYIVSNVLFLVMTLVYYGVFSGLMAITTSDEVLTVQSVQVNVGNPVWLFIIIIIVSMVYIFGMYKMLNHCFKNFRDMGFEIYAELAQLATSSIADKFDSWGSKLANWSAGKDDSGSATQSVKGTGGKQEVTANVTIDGGSVEAEVTGDNSLKNVNKNVQTEYDSTVYSYNIDIDIENSGAKEIDAAIERGKQMQKDDKDSYM